MIVNKELLFHFSSRSEIATVESLNELMESSKDSSYLAYSRSIHKKSNNVYMGLFSELLSKTKDKFLDPNKAPPIYISKYLNCFVVGRSLVLTANKKVAKDCILNNRYFNEPKFNFNKVGIINGVVDELVTVHIKEPCYYLSDSGLIKAYTHWFTEILTRLAPWFDFPENKRPLILVDQKISNYQLEMLEKLGVAKNEIIFKDETKKYLVNELYLPSPTGISWLHKLCFDIYDRLSHNYSMINVRKEYQEVGNRIFLARDALASRRSLLNIKKLASIAKGKGFELVFPEKMSLDEKIHVFRNAKYIIGEAGGGLTNIVFSKASTNILILASEQFPSPIFSNIASVRNVTCNYIIGPGLESKNYKHDNNSNFVISERLFKNALESTMEVEFN